MKQIVLATAALLAANGVALATSTGTTPVGQTSALHAPPLPPREAGARHGQALGVALICYGLHTTPAVQRLPAEYAGDARAAFESESQKTLAAWREAGSCKAAGGPNACRLVHEWSCRAALLEIGPEGRPCRASWNKKRRKLTRASPTARSKPRRNLTIEVLPGNHRYFNQRC